ncbi:PepSY domain-containing protein [Spongiibacter sp. KMU-158]|uniref:PepSY domain-containing protein n=1 Tax=Spongiibacter pelagi TaxID=2760804 RepID=A0A927C2B6_9GAMM|nr:PepSY-associated TM helix domain-containing protein [Spongiibacter pelagi]MBD2859464.1 PepSY domain-containing protein [Spongiibacter pelagi]
MAGARKKRAPGLWRWHRWAGLSALVVLFVASITGIALSYQKELITAVIAPGVALPESYSAIEMARDLEIVVAKYGDGEALNLKAPNSIEPYWTVRAKSDTKLIALDNLEPYSERLWFLDAMKWLWELHVHLLSGEIGEALLLVAVIFALFLCVSGLIMWWPGRRAFRWRFILPKEIRPSQWLQYHRHSGALVSPILIVVLLTGAIMVWQGLVFRLMPPPEVYEFPIAGVKPARLSQQLLVAQAKIPDAWPTYMTVSGLDAEPELKVRFRLNGEWHLNGRTTVWVSPVNGTLRVSERSDESALGRRLLNQLYPLHSGFGMNAIYRVLILLSGIGLLWLTVTGAAYYIKRERQGFRKKSHH